MRRRCRRRPPSLPPLAGGDQCFWSRADATKSAIRSERVLRIEQQTTVSLSGWRHKHKRVGNLHLLELHIFTLAGRSIKSMSLSNELLMSKSCAISFVHVPISSSLSSSPPLPPVVRSAVGPFALSAVALPLIAAAPSMPFSSRCSDAPRSAACFAAFDSRDLRSTSARLQPKFSIGHSKSAACTWPVVRPSPSLPPRSAATRSRISSASSSALMRYSTHGRHTAARHSDAGNGWMVHSSGTRICFCSRFSRFARFVSSLLVGSATPLRFT